MTSRVKTLFRARGMVSGTGNCYEAGRALLVEDGRILAVDEASALEPRAERTVDLGDAVLIPGLVDAHTHITIRPGEGDQHGQLAAPISRQVLRGVKNMAEVLESGVTTARIMGEKAGLDVEFRQMIERGEVSGPRLKVATRALSATHGHGVALGRADGPEELRRAVRENLRDGADHIKVFMTGGVSNAGAKIDAYHYSREEISAVVREAHRAGVTVAAHAHGGEGVTICAEEGVDSIEHGGLLTRENIEAMVENETWLVLTNSIAFHPSGIESGDAGTPEIIDRVKRVRSRVEEVFEEVKDSSLHFALGTDSMHGLFGYELEWLVEHGVSSEQAMIAATRNGAEVMGLSDEVGTLEPAKRADFVAISGNPLEDIKTIYDVVAVAKAGELQ